ncbi:hypothetical protein G7085_19675 [Tessaracoccus sp. HDW20]|uniref:hypothetical protein n=1 Tax=Tessaracoccus coleopterorum TaxID=2714950 RepID=UPI0018D38568|nr:hypothetical protein [Tessaracoccus coleopterorum]NHB86009.1 hypothetical protein [Tessaracoccus coleopterorum]
MFRVMERDRGDLDAARALIDTPGMPARWVARLVRRLEGHPSDDTARVEGPPDA